MNGMTTLPAEVVLADVHHPQAPHVPKSLPSAEEPKHRAAVGGPKLVPPPQAVHPLLVGHHEVDPAGLE